MIGISRTDRVTRWWSEVEALAVGVLSGRRLIEVIEAFCPGAHAPGY
jgi:hypothetical protein